MHFEDVGTIIARPERLETYRAIAREGADVFPNCIVHADYEANRKNYPGMAQRGMRDLYGKHQGETVFICGSGPSLKGCPAVTGHPTIAINRAIQHVQADYWAFVDLLAWRLCGSHPNAQRAAKLFGSNMYILLEDVENAYQVDFSGSPNAHRKEARRPLYFNCNTFSWAVHLAQKMGAKRIVTVGCEFSGDPQYDGFVAEGCEGPGLQARLMDTARGRMLEMFGADRDQWFDPNVELLDASGGALPIPKVRLEDVL